MNPGCYELTDTRQGLHKFRLGRPLSPAVWWSTSAKSVEQVLPSTSNIRWFWNIQRHFLVVLYKHFILRLLLLVNTDAGNSLSHTFATGSEASSKHLSHLWVENMQAASMRKPGLAVRNIFGACCRPDIRSSFAGNYCCVKHFGQQERDYLQRRELVSNL